MKKSTLALVGAMAFATTFAVAPQAHAEINEYSNLNDKTVVVRQPGQSMVLSMREVAGIFVGRYVKAAVSSITLDPSKGNYQYVVVGYTPKQKITIDVDVITGKVIREFRSSKAKDVASKVFNPLKVVAPKQAEAAARELVGEGSFSRGWEIKAENNEVRYIVRTQATDEKEYSVVVDAVTGKALEKGEPIDWAKIRADRLRNDGVGKPFTLQEEPQDDAADPTKTLK